jgi:IS30 family transposase
VADMLQAFSDKLMSIAQPMRQGMTYYQGREMARHKELAKATGVAVHFCAPPKIGWILVEKADLSGLHKRKLLIFL